jgi:hypothetical protein
VGVGDGDGAEGPGEGAQLAGPVGIRGIQTGLPHHELHDSVEEGVLVLRVSVQGHGVAAEGLP